MTADPQPPTHSHPAPDLAVHTSEILAPGTVAVDEQGLIVAVGSRLARMLGHAPEELVGRPIEMLVPAATLREAGQDAFRIFFDASPYGQVLVDGDGTIVLANRALREIVGHREAELVGRPLSTLLPERHRDPHQALLHGYFEDPQVRMMGTGRDLTARHADGTEVPVEVGLSWLPWAGASTDVVRNLDRIGLRIDRMQTLLDALLAYARSAGGAWSASEPSGLALLEVADVVRGILELDPLPAGFQLGLDIDVEPFPAVRSPFETVLRNLIANAVKHHDRADGRIWITARPDATWCRLDVRDDGPGIPEAAHDRIFRLFQTLDDGPGRSGIGLALVKRLVGSHGGRVEVVSPATPGDERGAAFRVWWPRFPRRGLDES